MYNGEPRFTTMDLIDQNVVDLASEVDALNNKRGRMVAVVDDEAGGIIAYAIGENHASMIVETLNARS